MSELDSARLDFMAKRELGEFDQTCTIQRAAIANGAQGPVTTWTQRATGVHCSLFETPRIPREIEEAGSVKSLTLWQINLPALQTVAVTDRIVIGSRTFEVEQIVGASFPTIVVCLATEVK
jgi:hypothetical protein